MSRRPPAPVRYVVLLAALIALFGSVCARVQTPPAASAPPDAAPREYFPATKAPGPMFP